MVQKLHQPDSDGPDIRLTAETGAPGHYGRVYLQRNEDGNWEPIGSVELHPALPADQRGAFAEEGPLVEWSRTRHHANGDRVRVDHRLKAELDADEASLRIKLQKRREETLGFGNREEHVWRVDQQWTVSPDSIEADPDHCTS